MNAARFFGICLLGSTLVACQRGSQVDVGATRGVFDSLLVLHAEHIVRQDLNGLLANYTADAVVRSNHAEPLRGHPAIRSFAEGMFASMNFHTLSYHTEGLAVYGDSAWQIVTYGLTGASGSQTVADSGSAYLLWTRDGGRWRIKDDILNSRLPLP